MTKKSLELKVKELEAKVRELELITYDSLVHRISRLEMEKKNG